MTDFDVIVAGAGPVGAFAAYLLARVGINVLLIESGPACAIDLRASTFHPPTLEMLEKVGLLDRLMPIGLIAPIYQYRNMVTGDVLSLDLGELADFTPHPYRVQCEQWKLAELASSEVNKHKNGTVLFSRRVTSFSQNDSGVVVNVESPYAIETFSAKYLIACDGGNSIIRKWLGIEFDGFTYPEKFLCISVDYPFERDLENLAYVNYIADPVQWMVLLKTPSVWRILVPASEVEPDDLLTSEETKRSVLGRLVKGSTADIQTEHRTIYRVHQRVARNYRAGRVILAGDAAHLNNPLGGFGMNSGLHDVWNLTAKLDRIINGGENDDLLDLYHRQRQTVMNEFVQQQTIKNKKAMEQTANQSQVGQETELRELLANAEKRREYLLTQSMFRSLEREAQIV